jgi:hypothetical protein
LEYAESSNDIAASKASINKEFVKVQLLPENTTPPPP